MRNSKTFLYLRNKLQVLGSALTGNSLYKCAHRRTLQQKKGNRYEKNNNTAICNGNATLRGTDRDKSL